MKTKATTLRITTALVLCLCLMLMSISFAPQTLITASAQPNVSLDDADVAEGARQFDEGVRDIESILNLDLTTEKGVKQSAAILKRNEKKLAQVEKKALHAALRVSSFQKGLKEEAAKRKGGAEELAKELEANRELIGNIPGAEEAAKAIRDSTRPAAEALQRVSEALKKAADEAKAKNTPKSLHHANLRSTAQTEGDAEIEFSNPTSQSFCGQYRYICDLLTRLGLYYLRQQLALFNSVGGKANCVLIAYTAYASCSVNPPWYESATCQWRLSWDIRICLL